MSLLKPWTLKIQWQIAIAMILGVAVGLLVQQADPAATLGFSVEAQDGKLFVRSVTPKAPKEMEAGDQIVAVAGESVATKAAFDAVLAKRTVAELLALDVRRGEARLAMRGTVTIGGGSDRAAALAPFEFIAEIFMRLLQMLIVPLIVTSIISGVVSVGNLGVLGRMGLKTITFYVVSSLLAILVGLVLVNMLAPGDGAQIPLTEKVTAEQLSQDESLVDIFKRMVPPNVFAAFSSNRGILQVIVFSIIFGIFILRVGGERGDLLKRFFEAAFEVMMKMAEFILTFIPIGVLALIARVVGASGIEVFVPLLKLMVTVILALGFHALVTLPLILYFLGRVNPLKYAKAVSPALLTAFSTSSSSVTLPVTMRSVEKRGGVSNRTASFVLPLGATINMDGTALYECVAVLFLAQYYASTGQFELTLAVQLTVVITALLASIGAAGIPSAGLVMMTTILGALGLPLEGVVLLLAIDRPLDMLRTAVNNWSDSTCAAVIATSEGEEVHPRSG